MVSVHSVTKMALLCLLFGVENVVSAPAADLVDVLPQFNRTSFKVYSGYLSVPGPFKGNKYDSLSIHYQFEEAQSDAAKAPVVTWHQGGPGGSSISVGDYTEMGYFQLSDKGPYTNDFSWNKVANMLYLESPAGSGESSGFSTCISGGKAVACEWNDVNQGEAYAHTLQAFFKAFPEYGSNDLYLTGESYFGQYGPNIAHFIVNDAHFSKVLNLKGMALGNACWGGDANTVRCNGPNSDQNDIDMFFGKGLVSKELYTQIYATCKFPNMSLRCENLLEKASREVGPHNVYNIYDNCPRTAKFLRETGKSMRWLRKQLRAEMNSRNSSELGAMGGYDWSCGGIDKANDYLTSADVRKALHLQEPGQSEFGYRRSGPASITLYPELIKKLRILIYNGDADSCVPYKGNEEWITDLKNQNLLSEAEPWRPWYADGTPDMPAGYVTKYSVAGADTEFHFLTIRLAGHMVPTFQPAASLSFFTRFLADKPF